MPDERRPAAPEAEDQVKVVDRRRFRADGDPVDDVRDDDGSPAAAPDDRDDRLAAQSARLDELTRAYAGEDVQGELRSLVEGVRLSLGVLHRRVAELGAQRIQVVGRPFDPHVAEAVDTVPIADAALDGVVLQEIRAGYRIGERVLRPARVRVGRVPRA